MYTVFDFDGSGNGYKVWLLLHFLGEKYERVRTNILEGETHTADFLKINPVGKIPALVLEDGRSLPESNAIMHYLAEGTPWLPDDRFAHAQVLSWTYFEQYSHEPNIAVLRFWRHFLTMTPELEAQAPEKEKKSHAALAVMEKQLSKTDWLVGSDPTIADIALYAYTHVADEGGISLDAYPGINRWIDRFARLPNYVPITYHD